MNLVNTKKTLLYFGLAIACLLIVPTSFVHAKKTLNDAAPALKKVSGQTGITEESVPNVVGNALQGALFISGLLFFVFIVYAGIVWLTARGKEERIEKAKKTMIGSTIAIVILISSYGIVNFVQTRVIEGQSGDGVNPFGPNQAGNVPIGCCLDWVDGVENSITGPISQPAIRMTTFEDCKYFGENGEEGSPKDYHSCPQQGDGCWLWFSSEDGWDFKKCEDKKLSY